MEFEKFKSIGRLASTLFVLTASGVYLIAVPALVATKAVDVPIYALVFGVFMFLQLLLLITEFVISCLTTIYGLPMWSPLSLIGQKQLGKVRSGLLFFMIILAYILLIYSFAVMYAFVSNYTPTAFNVREMSLFSAIYFSVITIATVGYGDIVPLSPFARVIVMLEILIGLAYAVIFFSVASTLLREKPSDITESRTSGGVSER